MAKHSCIQHSRAPLSHTPPLRTQHSRTQQYLCGILAWLTIILEKSFIKRKKTALHNLKLFLNVLFSYDSFFTKCNRRRRLFLRNVCIDHLWTHFPAKNFSWTYELVYFDFYWLMSILDFNDFSPMIRTINRTEKHSVIHIL